MSRADSCSTNDRGDALDDVLSRGQIIHLGLIHPRKTGTAYVVPLNYGYRHDQETGERWLYMHTSHEGFEDSTPDHPEKYSTKAHALVRASDDNQEICFEVEAEAEVLPFAGGTCCLSTTRYSSVVGFGKVELIQDDQEEKKRAMATLLRQNTGIGTQFFMGCDAKSEAPGCPLPDRIDDHYLSQLVVVKLRITEFKVKVHGYSTA